MISTFLLFGRYGLIIIFSYPIIIEDFKKRSAPMGKAFNMGMLIVNIIIIIVALTLIIFAVVFIKGGLQAIIQAWKSFVTNIANFKLF
jgi:hypothetical protein